uniref:Exportin-1 C-terminal domain-containing protein n=1 Tax=Panagrolaimus sp. ES5 TaxID=591445 RepID=A0AC34EZL3_9BILA
MIENPQVKNLSDLCGIRLLYELCVACNTLPQIPVTTLSVLFEIMQTAGQALTAANSPYQKEFLQIVFPRLQALVKEDVSNAIDGITVRLADASFGTHLTKMHSIVRQRVLDALEKIGIIKS